jgi:hypothetical protein
MNTSKINIEKLNDYAVVYINDCLDNTREHVTHGGQIVHISDPHTPTVNYFLRIWLPRQGFHTISRATYYQWLSKLKDSEEGSEEAATMQNINEMFNAVAEHLLCNSPRANVTGLIFYAKNKLNFSDKSEREISNFTPHVVTITGMEIL